MRGSGGELRGGAGEGEKGKRKRNSSRKGIKDRRGEMGNEQNDASGLVQF